MKTESWSGYDIRFVEKDGEWWAVGKDIAVALEYAIPHKAIKSHCKGVLTWNIPTNGGKQEVLIISEMDIYNLIFKAADQSRSKKVKEKAEEFKLWVFNIIKQLRQSTGLEGFQIFRMLDKEHQKEAMQKLHKALREPKRVDFIKANTISNKAVSNKYGFEKMVKKADMTPEMLVDRQEILEDTVSLMEVKEKFHLDISVSDKVYEMVNKSGKKVG